MRALAGVSAAAVIALAGCDGPPAAAPAEAPATEVETPTPAAATGFEHEFSDDRSGYYMPVQEIRVGSWVLDHMFMGQRFDFEAWEGGDRSATFAPFMIEFEDTESPMVQSELGESRSGRDRVLPTAYAVTGPTIRFEGQAGTLGPMRFEGRLDEGALATARRNLGSDAPVLTGTLTVGERTFPGVSMRWWMGD